MDIDKPIVIFTTFWDALSILKNNGFLVGEKMVCFEDSEAEAFSIALAQPSIEGISRFKSLNFFAPTWDILKNYKRNRDWGQYKNLYRNALVENKEEIVKWVDSLEPGKIYILCCWENTCDGAKCHRQIISKSLSSSNRTKDLIYILDRHGDKKQYDREKQIVTTLKLIDNVSDFERLFDRCLLSEMNSLISVEGNDLECTIISEPNPNPDFLIDNTSEPFLIFEIFSSKWEFGDLASRLESQGKFEVRVSDKEFPLIEVQPFIPRPNYGFMLCYNIRSDTYSVKFRVQNVRFVYSDDKILSSIGA